MEVLVAGLVVLAVAYLVIDELASDAPAVPDVSVPVTTSAPELPVATLTNTVDTASAVALAPAARSDPPPAPAVAPGSLAAAAAVAEPAPKPFRSPEPRIHAIPHFTPVPPPPPRPPRESQAGPVRSTSVLGSLGPTEPDRQTHPMRRTASALALTAITLAIAGGVGGAIYLGLRQLG